ncbi:hypothetical protein V6N13_111166 [Hibiscus sabdariffa]
MVLYQSKFGLPSLQILDLSHNNLSGNIPSCIKNLTGMISRNKSDGKIPYKTSKGCFFDHMELIMMKGVVFDYSSTLKLIKLVDLSDNNLSENNLCGEIPEAISALTFLSYLNLSYNNKLTGKIPTGTQLQSFNSSSFLGTKLYGPPLTNASRDSKAVAPSSNSLGENVDDGTKVNWFVICCVCGFFSVAWAFTLADLWDYVIFMILQRFQFKLVAF